MKSEWGAPVKGSDPTSGHSVHNTTGDKVAGAGQASDTNTFGCCCVGRKQATKNLDPSPMAKNRPFFSPVFPIAAVRAYLQPVSFFNIF